MSNKSEQEDLISYLPDRVTSHILSRLPTRDAVRTSILSKAWVYKWTHIRNYVLSDASSMDVDESKERDFASFVERTFLLSKSMQSLDLDCIGVYNLLRWTTAALSRNVRSLCIECFNGPSFTLPRNLPTCSSLTKLRLHIPGCTLKVHEKICFHNLIDLSLCFVWISNEHSDSNRVEFNFPLLEKLQLEYCKWFNVKSVEIYAPKMTSLELTDPDSKDCSFKINGDSLVRFKWHGDHGLTDVDLSGSVNHIAYADLSHFFEGPELLLLEKNGLQIQKLLEGFSNLKDLELGGHLIEAIAKSKPGHPLPRYYKMERLALYHYVCTEVLFELLHAAPYLKLLLIDVEGLKEHDFDIEESVPTCVLSYLEKVTFISFTGKTGEMKLVKFFLKNAAQLKSVVIQPYSLPPAMSEDQSSPFPQPMWVLPPPMSEKEKCVVIEELSTYPTTSTCLSLRVEEVEHEKLNVAC